MESQLFLTLYWNRIMERSLYWYIGNPSILTNTYTTALTTKQDESVVSSLCNRSYSIIISKDDLTKENARLTQVLKENGYQESIFSKIFKNIKNNHSFSQWQQQTQSTDIQKEEIRVSINLPYVEGTSESVWRILRFHKRRSTFYTESTFRKLLCKPKDLAATEDKNNVIYEIDYSNCESVYFSESKRSLKLRSDEQKRSVRNGWKELWKEWNCKTLLGSRSQLWLGSEESCW